MSICLLPVRATVMPPPPKGDEVIAIAVEGSKHAELYILIAALIGDTPEICIENVPPISDIEFFMDYAVAAGAKVVHDRVAKKIHILSCITHNHIPTEFIYNCRSSLLALTIHAIRFGEVTIPLKFGGCKLGDRPIDQHILVWKAAGFSVEQKDGHITLRRVTKDPDGICTLVINSTMATVAAAYMIAAGLLKTCRNANNRPEIQALISFLRELGTEVKMEGNNLVRVSNVPHSDKVFLRIPDDPDDAVSMAALIHATGAKADISFGCDWEVAGLEWLFTHSAGEISRQGKIIRIRPGEGRTSILGRKASLIAMGYPGIASDQQPVLTAWAVGMGYELTLRDERFPNRYAYLEELQSIGWRILSRKDNAFRLRRDETVTKPVSSLRCTDLRSSFAYLIGAAFLGVPLTLDHYEQIYRGYGGIDQRLVGLGWTIDTSQLPIHTYVAALLRSNDGKTFLQKRDERADIRNPGKITLFGGRAEDGEDPESAIRRELKEELQIEPSNLTRLGEHILNEDVFGINARAVVFMIQDIAQEELQLQEGCEIITLGNENLAEQMTPFCTWVIKTYAV
jgi:UDP-N-acetylglucosamine 1-carboxyvinyltransferase